MAQGIVLTTSVNPGTLLTMIALTPTLHLISEDEFSTIRDRETYRVICVGKYDMTRNTVTAYIAPDEYHLSEDGYKPFHFEDGWFRYNGAWLEGGTSHPFYLNFVNGMKYAIGKPVSVQDKNTATYMVMPVLDYKLGDDGWLWCHFQNRTHAGVSAAVVIPSGVDPDLLTGIVLDQRSMDRIHAKSNSVSLLTPGSVATSHLLVGVGVTDFASEIEELADPAPELNTPFYEAYRIPTSQLTDELIEQYELVLSPSQEDMRQLDAAIEACTFADDRLHADQLEAVKVHLCTSRGYVNAIQMGDGKTVSTLVALNELAERQVGPFRSLVVLEANVRKQWMTEAKEWLDDDWTIVSITSRTDTAKLQEAIDNNVDNNKLIVLCSYTLAADAETEETDLGKVLANSSWDDVVIDEGRTVRGQNKTARALWKIRQNSLRGIVLCGTPLLKSVRDLGALMAWARNDETINGTHLTDLFTFSSDDPKAEVYLWYGWWGSVLIRSTTSRKSRADRIQRPTVRTEVVMVTPTPYEIQISQMIMGKIKETLENVIKMYRDSGNELTKEQEKSLRGSILATQSVARMAASDVRVLSESPAQIAALLAAEGMFDFPEGFVPSKMKQCVLECQKRPEPVVVFTRYPKAAAALKAELEKVGIKSSLFVGTSAIAKRDADLDEWKAGNTHVLIATSAAERGLNLQHAKHVIHYDHEFTSDTIFQRQGRTTRIGSEYTEVDALFLVTKNTIDEKVFSIGVARAGLAGATAAKSTNDFAESDAASMLRVLVQYANPIRLPNRAKIAELELTQILCS